MAMSFTGKAAVTSIKGITKGDARWAHAVNSLSDLEEALATDVNFIEVDIVLSAEGVPIAAHPPINSSDLTIAHLLERLMQTVIGVKLDFKDAATVMPVIMELVNRPLPQQVFLNADILPAEGTDAPLIDGAWFIDACNLYPTGIVSVGWRTNAPPACTYSERNITEMLALTKNISGAVTFPIRASLMKASWNHIRELITQPNRSLTIWDSEPLGPELMKWIQSNTDPALCYYDIELTL